MSTAIAAWGNAAAVRIPRDVLEHLGLRLGDRVSFEVSARGTIEMVPEVHEHRRCVPAKDVTFDSLFRGYQGGRLDNRDAWGHDEPVGAGREAWTA